MLCGYPSKNLLRLKLRFLHGFNFGSYEKSIVSSRFYAAGFRDDPHDFIGFHRIHQVLEPCLATLEIFVVSDVSAMCARGYEQEPEVCACLSKDR